MNGEKAIAKINSAGKVGGILALIAKIVVIIGIVMLIAAAAALAMIPKGAILIGGGTDTVVTMDAKALGMDKEDINEENIRDTLNGPVVSGDEIQTIDEIKIEGDKITVKGSTDAAGQVDLHDFVKPLIMMIIYLLTVLIVIWAIGSLCKRVKRCESPFEDKVVSGIRNLGFSMIPLIVTSSLCKGVNLSYDGLSHFDFTPSFDLSMLFLTIVVFIIASVFKYGAEMQGKAE